MRKCVNCSKRSVGKPNADGFARCRECGCSNIIPRTEDFEAAARFQSLLSRGWPHSTKEAD